MITVKRLYVENYKLFSQKEIDFSSALLSVFDGPNGYGKTSLFDALELLITGQISRVKECEAIDGKTAYKTIFFAKNHKKDVVIKAEFEDKEVQEYFVLGAKVKCDFLKGKNANPKNLFEYIDFYYMTSYNTIIEEWEDYLKNKEEIDKIRKEKFGNQNIDKFTLLHYIRQEDRLSYFKKNESSRSSTIENLLGVDSESEKQKSIMDKCKSIDKLRKQLEENIKNKRERLIESDSKIESNTEYFQLIDGTQQWDTENIYFGNSNQEKILEQYFYEIDRLEKYIQYADTHNIYLAYRKYMEIPENFRNQVIQAFILMKKNSIKVDDIEAACQIQKFIKQQKEKIILQDYLTVDVQKLCEVLNVETDKELIDSITSLKDISKNQSELQKALNNVLKIRDNLYREHSQVLNDGICPYCGYDWENENQLKIHFSSTKDILQRLLSQDGERFENQQSVIKGKIETDIYKRLLEKEKELSKIYILDIYNIISTTLNFNSLIENARDLIEIIYQNNEYDNQNLDDIQKYSNIISEECTRIGNSFSSEYLSALEKYGFENIRNIYGTDIEKVSETIPEKFKLKKQYIQEQFYKSFDKLREEIKDLQKQYEKLDVIAQNLKKYAAEYKKSIMSYKKQIIDEIEIPFFVYSSRLLQSYQGGQGVLMSTNGTSIRFTAPGKEHDVLYTMSSGQLSAVLLSFSLALNKIYAGNGIGTILIDDPIQCMDDINMISFVELLRREFSDCQIILSTHEEDFSNFIRYKFKKYDLNSQAITLKDA